MQYLVRFRLHAPGRVPQFIANMFRANIASVGEEYIGVTRDCDAVYVPDTLKRVTESEAEDLAASATMIERSPDDVGDEAVELDDAEKRQLFSDWLASSGYNSGGTP